MYNAEKGHSSQNHKAETEIRELKARWKTWMTERQVPKRLWIMALYTFLKFSRL
jgi:rubredoxin